MILVLRDDNCGVCDLHFPDPYGFDTVAYHFRFRHPDEFQIIVLAGEFYTKEGDDPLDTYRMSENELDIYWGGSSGSMWHRDNMEAIVRGIESRGSGG